MIRSAKCGVVTFKWRPGQRQLETGGRIQRVWQTSAVIKCMQANKMISTTLTEGFAIRNSQGDNGSYNRVKNTTAKSQILPKILRSAFLHR